MLTQSHERDRGQPEMISSHTSKSSPSGQRATAIESRHLKPQKFQKMSKFLCRPYSPASRRNDHIFAVGSLKRTTEKKVGEGVASVTINFGDQRHRGMQETGEDDGSGDKNKGSRWFCNFCPRHFSLRFPS